MSGFLATTRGRIAGAAAVAVLLHLIGTLLIPGYSAPFAVRAMLVIASLLAVASIGQTLVVILGGIDLSIPFVIGFANVVAAQLYGQGWNFALVCLLVAALALAIGAVNGPLSASTLDPPADRHAGHRHDRAGPRCCCGPAASRRDRRRRRCRRSSRSADRSGRCRCRGWCRRSACHDGADRACARPYALRPPGSMRWAATRARPRLRSSIRSGCGR